MALAMALAMAGCNRGIVYNSSVPNAPVQLSINTKDAHFVHFIPANIGTWVSVDRDGFHINSDKVSLPLTFSDYYGYAGVVMVVNCYSEYSAFDLCCPHCLTKYPHLTVKDGSTAVCPICGEEYNMAFGLGTPMKGISHEALKRYSCMYSGDRLTVHN